jgi:CxxC-x17-CxxC domain-containing protein
MSRKARREKAERNKAFVDNLKKLKAMRKSWKRPLASAAASTAPVSHTVICSTCGVTTRVPFEPTQGKPVLCRPCYDKRPAREGREARAVS